MTMDRPRQDCRQCELIDQCHETGDAFTAPPWISGGTHDRHGCHIHCDRVVQGGGAHLDCDRCNEMPSNETCPTLVAWAQRHPEAPGAAAVVARRERELQDRRKERSQQWMSDPVTSKVTP